MKKKIIIGLIAVFTLIAVSALITMSALTCRESVVTANVPRSASLFDLFYGMEQDSMGRYADARLDTIPGLIHKECKSVWYIPSDREKFEMTMGLYIDEAFPSNAVRNAIFEKLNAVIPEGFAYDANEAQKSLLKKGVKSAQSTDSFIRGWEKLFDEVSAITGYSVGAKDYPQVPSSRGCTVCHKIHEDSVWVTYIVEISIDYHISSGCPSRVDYFTINKATGEVLSVPEFMSRHKSSEVERLVRKAYCDVTAENGSPTCDISGKDLIKDADGIAILDEGILFYYYPYNLGSGAFGQFNLIIPVPE